MKRLSHLLTAYRERGRALSWSPHTLRALGYHGQGFLDWLQGHRGVRHLQELRPADLEAWHRHVTAQRSPQGLPVQPRTINKHIEIVRGFLRHLTLRALLPADWLQALAYVKEPQVLPAHLLTHRQVQRLLARIDTTTPAALRDRAMIELLYSSGLRAAELLGLQLGDIDWANATARVTGKGRRQRVVPIGRTALRYLANYVQGVRPALARRAGENTVFLDDRGQPMPYHTLRRRIQYHARRCPVPVTPHTFRRSCTTELIRGGANLYHVKELLGHQSLDTLQHYTRLTILDLKKTHARCHPRERLPAP